MAPPVRVRTRSAGELPAAGKPNGVDGRDKPGHDGKRRDYQWLTFSRPSRGEMDCFATLAMTEMSHDRCRGDRALRRQEAGAFDSQNVGRQQTLSRRARARG